MKQETIQISNDGPIVTATNYWASPYAQNGLVFCSVNAGTIRVLLPPARYGDLKDMIAAKYCVLSRGPWPEQNVPEGIEILFEDNSDSPYCLHLTPDSFDLLPAEPEPGREWMLSVWVWVEKEGPFKYMERTCYWRRVERIPCLKDWAV